MVRQTLEQVEKRVRTCKENALFRLKKVLLEDKLAMDATGYEMLRADLTRVFNTYFEYDPKDLKIALDVDNGGILRIAINLNAERSLPINGIKK